MMNNKIKALLQLKGETVTSYANHTKRSQANISNKIARSSWNAADLIALADLTNTTLAFNDNETGKPLIEFDKSDLKESKDQ